MAHFIVTLLTSIARQKVHDSCLCNDKGLNWNQPSISTLLQYQCRHSTVNRFL